MGRGRQAVLVGSPGERGRDWATQEAETQVHTTAPSPSPPLPNSPIPAGTSVRLVR